MNYDIVKNSQRIQWTQEQIDYIIDQYSNEMKSLSSIARDFGCDKESIQKVLLHNNVRLYTLEDYHPRNKDYFSVIDSYDKAYWLGMMYSDGCVTPRATGIYGVKLEMIDGEHVEKFKNALGATRNKTTVVHPKGFENASTVYSVTIYDKKIGEDLIALGCVPRKSLSLTKLPNIEQKYIYSFIRGVFDGDGCLRYDKIRKCYGLSFVSGSVSFLTEIRDVLGISRIKVCHSHEKAYRFELVAQNDLYRILTSMYKDSTEDSRLDRKYNKYQEFIEWYINKNKEAV